MTAHHCTMCLATKIPLVCMLFCVPSWISGSSGVVAQVNNETTQYTTLSTSHVGVEGLDPTAGGLHIHDHNGFQIKETSLHDVAREEGKYFVSLLFTKYGNQNETLHRSNLLELFHNLGFSGQNDEHIHASETKDKSVHNENHKRDFHETKRLSKTLHVHDDIGSHVHDDIGSHVHDDISSHLHDHVHDDINSHNHISDNKKSNSLHFQEQAKQFTPSEASQSNISHPDVHLGKSSLDNNDKLESSKHNSELRHDTGQKYERASDSISSHSNTNISIHEQNYNKQNVKQNSSSQFSERDSENVDLKMNVAGGKKHKGKSGRRAKKGRKQKTKKQESESLLSRTERDVSKQSVLHYHGDHTKCLTIKEILEAFDLENKDEITLTDFLYMSPAIIHQLDAQNCTHKALGTIHDDHNDLHVENDSGAISKSINSIPSKVWGYSFAAVLIISLVGLLGVAVIPIMQKVFYNHLLQFLVALAVGALMGDALLHLLPHAIGASQMSHNHASPEQSHVSHTGTIWKGLCGLMGIFFFFLMERVLTIITEVKRKKKTKHRLKQSPHHSLCKLDFGKAVGSKLSSHTEPDYQSCEEMVMVVHPNKSLKSYADETHDGLLHSIRECDVDHGKGDEFKALEDETMMTDVQHTHSHHGHSHFDGPMPKSVASIAWMVILGDGIHNFSDGLAIGAAFANSVTGGFSTSIAVFCHELPHEIGDFAVLLRAGMSAKQAIVYNCVSSILCFVGMTIGVALGNIDDVTLWIFACVGGIFIYIALVDMLPEMTSVETKQGENPFCHLLLQCSGMLAGSSIMLLIAIFEDDLLTALD